MNHTGEELANQFTPFYKKEPWVSLFEDKGWKEMTDEQRKEFLRLSREDQHERDYIDAVFISGVSALPWDNLTEEQRKNIRQKNIEYHKEMSEFRKSLSKQ